MAITTEAGLQTALDNAEYTRWYKGAFAGGGNNALYSCWRLTGSPGAGATPTTTGTALSRTSTGALPIPAPNATSYMLEADFSSFRASQTPIFADRLVEFGGLSGTVTTAQSVSALALPSRATGGANVELWIDIMTAIGATPSPTVTASYTNQSGTSGRTATLVGGIGVSWIAGRTAQFTLQAGDTGVRSVESLTSTTSTGTAGNIGLVLRRTLVVGPHIVLGSMRYALRYAELNMQIIPDDAALELLVQSNNGNSADFHGSYKIGQG